MKALERHNTTYKIIVLGMMVHAYHPNTTQDHTFKSSLGDPGTPCSKHKGEWTEENQNHV